MIIAVLVTAVVALIAGLAIGYVVYYFIPRARLHSAEDRAEKVLLEAEGKGKEILLVAKDEALALRTDAEAENKERRAGTLRPDRRIQQKQESLNRRPETRRRRSGTLTP